jgi:hypothetical protein
MEQSDTPAGFPQISLALYPAESRMTFSSNYHPALIIWWSMIFSENWFPFFGIVLWERQPILV